ncbi:hypothetical protein JOS77_23205 [Chromobacterium haemolyticum]|nr:hypothetical protein JOS77_23205 [Chromobacterium haemolyticum]
MVHQRAFHFWSSISMSLRPLLPLAALLLSACAYTPVQKPVAGDDFRGNELGQSSANRTANLAMRDNLASLQTLLEKLYKRNPKEWRKTGAADYPAAMRQVMSAIRNNAPLPALAGQRSIAAMSAAFDPGFGGDRAGALIYGMGSMLVDAYGGRTELCFWYTDWTRSNWPTPRTTWKWRPGC